MTVPGFLRDTPPRIGLAVMLLVALLTGCENRKKGGEQQDTSAPPPTLKAKDVAARNAFLPPEEEVQKVVNPRKLKPYTGPVGKVRGVVRVAGDESPPLPKVLAKMERNCTLSRSMFGTVFREGPGRTLADVLVAVTEYEGYVPAKGTTVEVTGSGCAWHSRTITMTFGQKLSIAGNDNRPYVPEILGQPTPAQLFAIPTAPAVELPARRPGRYKLVDSMRLYNVSELFVLPYRTVDVTDLDGIFEIDGVPVGKVKVNALLPQTGAVEGKEIEIDQGRRSDRSRLHPEL